MKGRQIRRKDESASEDSDDEASAAIARSQLAAKKAQQTQRSGISGTVSTAAAKKGKVSLSFGGDSDDDENSAIILKKSKASRALQTTKIPAPLLDVDPSSNTPIQSSGYDLESLAALRKEQNFTSGVSSSASQENFIDGGFEVEIGGDEAEALEAK